MTCLIAGSSNIPLAKKIAGKLSIDFIDANISKFPDSELNFDLFLAHHINSKNIIDQKVFVFQSLSQPVNDHLIELLLISKAIKHLGASKITAIIPYLAYTRQDQPLNPGSVSIVELIVSLLKNSGVDNIITIDLHSGLVKRNFKVNIDEISFGLFLKNVILKTLVLWYGKESVYNIR